MKNFTMVGLVVMMFMLSLSYAYSSSYKQHEPAYESNNKGYDQGAMHYEVPAKRFGSGFDKHIYGSYEGHSAPEHYKKEEHYNKGGY